MTSAPRNASSLPTYGPGPHLRELDDAHTLQRPAARAIAHDRRAPFRRRAAPQVDPACAARASGAGDAMLRGRGAELVRHRRIAAPCRAPDGSLRRRIRGTRYCGDACRSLALFTATSVTPSFCAAAEACSFSCVFSHSRQVMTTLRHALRRALQLHPALGKCFHPFGIAEQLAQALPNAKARTSRCTHSHRRQRKMPAGPPRSNAVRFGDTSMSPATICPST